MGSAGLMNGAITILTHSVPIEKRPVYLGFMISTSQLALAVGPLIGGALTQYASWRWCEFGVYISCFLGFSVAEYVASFICCLEFSFEIILSRLFFKVQFETKKTITFILYLKDESPPVTDNPRLLYQSSMRLPRQSSSPLHHHPRASPPRRPNSHPSPTNPTPRSPRLLSLRSHCHSITSRSRMGWDNVSLVIFSHNRTFHRIVLQFSSFPLPRISRGR